MSALREKRRAGAISIAPVIAGPRKGYHVHTRFYLRHPAGTLPSNRKSNSGDQFAVRRVVVQASEAKIVVKIDESGIVVAVGNL